MQAEVGHGIPIFLGEDLSDNAVPVLSTEWERWKDGQTSLRVQRVVQSSQAIALAVVPVDEDTAVPAFMDIERQMVVGFQAESCAEDDGGELRGLRQRRDEKLWGGRKSLILYVEAEEAGRVELSETAEESGVGDVP
jgi:hypothetical protein